MSDDIETKSGASRIFRERESFWVCGGSELGTELFILAPAAFEEQEGEGPPDTESVLTLYDVNGIEFNTIRISIPRGQVEVLELSSLMEGCGMHFGLRFAQLVVDSPEGTLHRCRLLGPENATFFSKPIKISDQHTAFFPVVFRERHDSLLCLVNSSDEHVAAKCRLFKGKRTPEHVFELGPKETVVASLETLFEEHATVNAGEELRAYIRISSKCSEGLGSQLIESTLSEDGEPHFTSIN